MRGLRLCSCWNRLGGVPTDLRPQSLTALDPRIQVPGYEREALGGGIVHVGVGGFHRAHQAVYLDDLCNDGLREWSITGTGVLAGDAAMAAALGPQHCLYTLMTRAVDQVDVRVIGAVVDYLHACPDPEPLVDLLAHPGTRIVSLTVTEGGYPVDPDTGEPTGTSPVFEAITAALQRRRAAGIPPFTVMSCDNVLHNGRVARAATVAAAAARGGDLAGWVEREVAFPSSMVDRITPVTTDADRTFLADEYGLVDRWPVVAEPFRQWVIEDTFAAGRPPWDEAGALLTGDVEPYELLKLRLLNAGHSVIAYLAALAGYTLVDEVLADPDFAGYLRRFLHEEAGPVVAAVPGVDVPAYIAQLLARFANPAIRDQVARLCLDGSSKFPVFLVPTIEAQLARGGPVELAALALAGWCRYLGGGDDAGRTIAIAADPRLDEARVHAEASRSRPAAFLEFDAVFPAGLRDDDRFTAAFTTALESLRNAGAQATVARWIRSGA